MTDNLPTSAASEDNWKTRVYAMGVMVGALMGFISAYLFARAAEENSENGKPQQIPTGTLLGLLLSAMSLMRQIAESGKQPKK